MVTSAGLFIDKPAASSSVLTFLEQFRSRLVAVDLIRLGGKSDGGYLVPNDLEGVKYCFSPGVDVKATFEKELAEKYGIRSFMADASVSEPPLDSDYFEFDPKFLGSRNDDTFITLSSWIDQKVGADDHDMLLQMDIEGAEYEVFVETPMDVLSRFRIMILEFHDLERLFDQKMLPLLSAVFSKLARNFSIAHVHPNNCRGVISRDGVDVPRVIEVSFIRNDRIAGIRSDQPISLPHPLDEMCCPDRQDVVMPAVWWRAS
jgi:hypothetical protein